MTLVRLLAMDVDGTMTDGSINISEEGEIFKKFNVKDGYGIKLLLKNNIVPAIVTGRCSKIVEIRAKELGVVEVYQSVKNKVDVMRELGRKYSIDMSEMAYIGDDLNDLSALSCVGFPFCPCDAVDDVKKTSMVLQSAGGTGAVRECVEHILNMNGGQSIEDSWSDTRKI